LNIVYLTTEAVPFAKTGGLADVCGTLPARVAALGHRTAVIMPAFRSIHQTGLPIKTTDLSFAISMGERRLMGARLLKSRLPDSEVPVWFIDQPQYFDRESLYGTANGDYPDNAQRFAFFCRAAIQAISRMGWAVDIVHCNDWQTGLVPALMQLNPTAATWTTRAASMMTIHNLAYQGHFPASQYAYLGLDWEHFHPGLFEFYGNLNFLKTGLVAADMITTVSRRYAEEICGLEQGCGLDGVLRAAGDRVVGIANGIDEETWNPATDPNLVKNYSVDSWSDGKSANKRALQHQFGLEENDTLPLIGLVGRLAMQKGWDLILPVLRWHLSEDRPTQWIVLGSGDAGYERQLRELAEMYPQRFALHIGFSDQLAHRIEAAADLFVMPSLYEPCGLNQIYSLRYGTIPVVTPTGGLVDTVTDCSRETLAAGTATGFFLSERSPRALDAAIGRALQLRFHEPASWAQMIQTGMRQDWSWGKSAAEYIEVYEQTSALKHNPIGESG